MNPGVHFITIAFSIEKQRPDGYAYYTISNNMGYEGDLEIAMVPEAFRVDVLKESLDANKVLVENANVETANFALMFEFDGGVKKVRHCLIKQLRLQTV